MSLFFWSELRKSFQADFRFYKQRKLSGSLLAVMMLTQIAVAQNDWELRKDDDGIKVFTRKVPGSEILEYKAESVMEGKLSEFVAVVKDVESYDELLGHAKNIQLIESNDTFHIHYLVTDLPWPVTDRDAVYSSTYRQNYDTKIVRVDIKLEQGYIEEKEEYVRMKSVKGYWLFCPLDYRHVEVIQQIHAEPGGSIPDWLINSFLVDTPLSDFKSLRERVKLEKYKGRKFDFLVDN
jgi:ribosome-associated toxin RatA of RatAB toxin-antitoxin module